MAGLSQANVRRIQPVNVRYVPTNYGKGAITYITADSGTEEIKSDKIPQVIKDLIRFPLGQQLYVRPSWREVQPRPGRLEMPDYLKLVFELAKNSVRD